MSGSVPDAAAGGSGTALALPAEPGGPDEEAGGRSIDPEVIARVVATLVVTACAAFVLWRMRPDLLARDSTPNGGDMGAHVWWPAYLRDHVLSSWRLATWSPDYWAGFPAGQFYFPLPALLVVAVDLVLPYNVAFKLVTALGPVALPPAAYSFLRGMRAPRPTPELGAIAAVAFLFFRGDPGVSAVATTVAFNQRIMGGTLVSTLAGEFSFTIALALGLFALGAVAVTARTGRRPGLAAVLLAATVLSHVVVGILAALGALLVVACFVARRRLVLIIAVGVVAALLTAVWTVPLLATFGYTNNMRYERIDAYGRYLFPTFGFWLPTFGLALVGVVVGIVARRRSTYVLIALAVVFALVFRFWPEAAAWNLRFLPFWYLSLALLAAAGAAEILAGAGRFVSRRWAAPDGWDPQRFPRVVTVGVTSVLVGLLAVVALVEVRRHEGFIDFWAEWNYSGYEDDAPDATRPKAYPEFAQLLETMGALPPGRALWEPSSAIDAYGTTLAPMLLPHFTDDRIASLEGVYYEASATTPYHFLAVSELATEPSNPQRGLVYGSVADFDLGVRHLQELGARYYLAQSDETKRRADAHPDLRLVAEVPDLDAAPPSGWKVYEVRGAEIVTPLQYEPVVLEELPNGTTSECFGTPATSGRDPELDPWECAAAPWWKDTEALDRPLAADGPATWERVAVSTATSAPRAPLAPVVVRDVNVDRDRISFRVSEPGVPVLVRVSYFPNWQVEGADGPYRVTPNFMVVVPTTEQVELRYGRTGWEWLGVALSAAGLLGVVGLGVVGGGVVGRVARRTDSRRGASGAPLG